MNNNKTNTINLTRTVNQYFTLMLLITLTVLLVLFSAQTTYAANQQSTNTVNILIKSEPVQFTDQTGRPFIDSNNRTLVPMRIVMEKYGCKVDWEQESLSAIVKKGDVTVKVPIMQKFIVVNNVKQDTDTQPQNINGRIYLPIASVLRAVGANVQWDNASRSVVVDGRAVEQGSTTNDANTNTQTTGTSSPTNVANAANVVGMEKPQGYDEFIKDFEIVDILGNTNFTTVIIKNKQYNSEKLESFLLTVPEDTIKKYIVYFISHNNSTNNRNILWVLFYSKEYDREMELNDGVEGLKYRILQVNVKKNENKQFISTFFKVQDWRNFTNK